MSETKKTQRDMLGEIVIREWRQQNRDWAERAGEAVAAHVRSEDAARGGMLSAHQLGELLSEVPSSEWVETMEAHLAAQGRALAALEAERNSLKSTVEAEKVYLDGAGVPVPETEGFQSWRVAKLVHQRDEARSNAVTERERAAERAMRRLGWTYTGGTEEWRQPVGPSASPLLTSLDEARAKAAALEEQVRTLTADNADSAKRLTVLDAEARGWRDRATASEQREKTTAEGAALLQRDAATIRARVAELEARLADAVRFHTDEHKDRKAAESALATLRHVVAQESARALECGEERGKVESMLLDALATPAPEHPDTAALRAIRERGKDKASLRMRYGMPGVEAVAFVMGEPKPTLEESGVVAVLGDSGPSGGGEEWRCHATMPGASRCGKKAGHEGVHAGTRMGNEHVEWTNQPTTPPDVAATEPKRCGRPAGRLRLPCALPKGHVGKSHVGLPPDEPTPTPEEDWRTIRDLVNEYVPAHSLERGRAALARLRGEPRRAAEVMRERCAEWVREQTGNTLDADVIQALPFHK